MFSLKFYFNIGIKGRFLKNCSLNSLWFQEIRADPQSSLACLKAAISDSRPSLSSSRVLTNQIKCGKIWHFLNKNIPIFSARVFLYKSLKNCLFLFHSAHQVSVKINSQDQSKNFFKIYQKTCLGTLNSKQNS